MQVCRQYPSGQSTNYLRFSFDAFLKRRSAKAEVGNAGCDETRSTCYSHLDEKQISTTEQVMKVLKLTYEMILNDTQVEIIRSPLLKRIK